MGISPFERGQAESWACSCVTALRTEIEQLRAELADYKDAAASEAEAVNQLTEEKRALLQEVAELRALIAEQKERR